MTSPPIVYRRPGPWGAGKGSDLSVDDGDGNTWNHEQRIVVLEGGGGAKEIDFFSSTGSSLFVHYTDSSVDGPFVITTAQWKDRGEWQPGVVYSVNDLVHRARTTLFLVQVTHTSALTFDPAATDGLGHDLYDQIFSATALVRSVTASTWTPVFDDLNNFILFENACTITVPSDDDFDAPVSAEITGFVYGTGAVQVVAGAGATLRAQDGSPSSIISGQYAAFTLKKINVSEWVIFGRIDAG